MCMWVCVYVHGSLWHVWNSAYSFLGISSLLTPCGTCRLISGHRHGGGKHLYLLSFSAVLPWWVANIFGHSCLCCLRPSGGPHLQEAFGSLGPMDGVLLDNWGSLEVRPVVSIENGMFLVLGSLLAVLQEKYVFLFISVMLWTQLHVNVSGDPGFTSPYNITSWCCSRAQVNHFEAYTNPWTVRHTLSFF